MDCLKNPDDAFQPLGKINDEVFDDIDQPTDSEIYEEVDLIDDVLEEEFDFINFEPVQDQVQRSAPSSPDRPSSQDIGIQAPDEMDVDTNPVPRLATMFLGLSALFGFGSFI